MLTPQSVRRLLSATTVGVYAFACLLMDLFPRHGPPDFRYTGSDPAIAVWNLGWPLAEFIYDPLSGLHVGPTAVPVVILQVFVLVFCVCIVAFVIWFHPVHHREPNR